MAIINITTSNFQEFVAERKGLVLLDFWAPWCGYCRRLEPAFAMAAEQYGEALLAGKINIDEAPELARRFHVEMIPTLMLCKDGEVVDRLVAPDAKDKIDAMLRPYLET